MPGGPDGRAQYEDTTLFLKYHEYQPVSGSGTMPCASLSCSTRSTL